MLFRKQTEPPALPAAPMARGEDREISIALGGGRTVIGAHTRIRGSIKGTGPLLVRGEVEGEIAIAGGLTVAPTGRVEADVKAQSLELSGEARGSVRTTEKVVLSPTGVFEGDMETPVLEVSPGSILHGRTRVAGEPLSDDGRFSH